MRPFPDETTALTAPGRHPVRPWWGAGSEFGGTGWTRSDGWQVTDNGYHYYSSAPSSLDLDFDTPEGKSYMEVMAFIDAKYPLAAPALRAGQVWLLEARNASTTALLDSIAHNFLWSHSYSPKDYAWSLGGERLTHSEAVGILLRSAKPEINAFLVADPVDAEFTPWTGAMGSGWP
jgi:hypothetical protein